MKKQRLSSAWNGWLEGILWLAVTLFLVWASLQLAGRAKSGLERYALDELMGQVVRQELSPQEQTMARLWEKEIGYLVPERKKTDLSAVQDFLTTHTERVKQYGASLLKKVRTETTPPPVPLDAATMLANHSAYQEKRYQELLSAMSAMNAGGINLASASVAYIAPTSENAKGSVPEHISAQYNAELLEYGRRKKVVDRLHPDAFRDAFKKYQLQFKEAGSDRARAEVLRESARLLDGRKPNEDNYTLKRILDAPKHAERALQATLLVNKGWWLWLGFSVWLWLAIQVGRRATRRRLATMGIVLGAAFGMAIGLQRWLGITAPLWLVHWGGAAAVSCIVLDRVLSLSWFQKRFAGQQNRRYPRREGVSPWLLPGWLAFVGIGWFLLVDLSLNFHPRLRFLLVDHIAGVWGAVLLMGIIPLLAPMLLHRLARILGLLFSPRHWGRGPGVLALVAFIPLVWWGGDSEQYITGEVIKAGFILLAAWFFVLRGPLLVHGSNVLKSLTDIFLALFPALVGLGALAIALILTKDLGPLLVILLCSCLLGGAFWGLTTSTIMTVSLFACIVWAGKTLPTVGGRVQSYLYPFGAIIDDMARLRWFQQEVPLLGFGFGNAPWRGYSFMETSVGLPLQLQSDYTFTGLMGVVGVGAWILVALIAFWGLELARAHARKTAIDPCSLMVDGEAIRDGFRSWMALVFGCLLTVQTALTVSGNLGLVPLTGITLPWMSFGNTALWVMTLFFALLVDGNKEDLHR